MTARQLRCARCLSGRLIEAAGHNVPFNRRDAVPDLIFKEADKFLGRRPSRHEMKNAMEEAIRLGELRYLPNTRHRAAGLYPPDAELARTLPARRRGLPGVTSNA